MFGGGVDDGVVGLFVGGAEGGEEVEEVGFDLGGAGGGAVGFVEDYEGAVGRMSSVSMQYTWYSRGDW